VRTLIRSNLDVWKQFVEHDFVKQLGQGTLSRERFVHFLKCAACSRSRSRDGLLIYIHPCRQDYLYLKYYARANGCGYHKLKLSYAEISDLFPLQSSGG
jgi:hydroxymethylpyrimidine/phosphomethylpyrimidine kinase